MLAASFAFAAGYADAICLVRYKVFATMMTGNLLLMGLSLVSPNFIRIPGETQVTFPLFLLCIILCKMLGVGLREEAERFHPYGTSILCPFLVLIFVAVEVVNYATPDPLYPPHYGVCFLAPIGGMVNSVSIHGVLGVPTTMATGHMQNMTYAVQDYFHEGKSLRNVRVGLHLVITAGLFFGVLAGGYIAMISKDQKWAELLMSPCLILMAIAVVVEDEDSTPVRDDEETGKSAREWWILGTLRIPHLW